MGSGNGDRRDRSTAKHRCLGCIRARPVHSSYPFREGNGRAQRAFFGQLARDAGFTLAWQHLDPARNVEASAAIMRGDPEPMREMLNALTRDGI